MLPLLWICGPSGVGKTTASWVLFEQLTQSGIVTGYVDIDQLGLCFGDPVSYQDHHLIKATNLAAAVAHFQAAGAECLVVSGVVDVHSGVPREFFEHTTLTVVRLRAGREQVRQRFLHRGAYLDNIAAAISDAEILDASSFADVVIDTTSLNPFEVATAIRRQVTVPAAISASAPPATTITVPDPRSNLDCHGVTDVLWICGVTGVGKSTVGYQVWTKLRRSSGMTGFVDQQQVGFLRPEMPADPGNHRLKARNLAAMARVYGARGAKRLVIVGHVEDERTMRVYAGELPGVRLTVCRLDAGKEALRERIALRGRGEGPWIPGDWLRGLPSQRLDEIAEVTAAQAVQLESTGIGDFHVPTDGLSTAEIVDLVIARL